MDDDALKSLRFEMVARQIEARGITEPEIIDAMRSVERHLFVPETYFESAYEDRPLPIGEGQTISQPYIVALMTSLVAPYPGMKVLEIGTGSGYQTAILAHLGAEVWSLEILESLHVRAKNLLQRMGYQGVHLKKGDGYTGWPSNAPYDAIIAACAPGSVPDCLKAQLAMEGRIVIPVGAADHQELVVVRRHAGMSDEWEMHTVIPVRFVPMVHAV